MKKLIVIGFVVTLVAAGAAGCKDDSGSSSASTTIATQPASGGGTLAFAEWQELTNSACAALNQERLDSTGNTLIAQSSQAWSDFVARVTAIGLPVEKTEQAQAWQQQLQQIETTLEGAAATTVATQGNPQLSSELSAQLDASSQQAQALGLSECTTSAATGG